VPRERCSWPSPSGGRRSAWRRRAYLVAAAQVAVERSGAELTDVSYLCGIHMTHSMHDAIVQALGIDPARASYLDDTGHMSGVDLLLGLDRAIWAREIASGDLVLLLYPFVCGAARADPRRLRRHLPPTLPAWSTGSSHSSGHPGFAARKDDDEPHSERHTGGADPHARTGPSERGMFTTHSIEDSSSVLHHRPRSRRRHIASVTLVAFVMTGTAAALGGDTVTGTGRADVIEGTEGADVMRGLAGNDTLRGRGGYDRLDGGPGADKLFGDAGNDYLFAGVPAAGVEELHGGPGNDVLVSVPNGIIRLVGGPGNDVLRGNSGISAFASDTFSGGPGNDKLLAVDITNTTDVFLPDACGQGRDLVELLRVPQAARADVVTTFRIMYGCERIVFR
jgi:hypothetical protein